MMPDGLWVWVWNWPNCDGGDYDAVAARLRACNANGVIVKASDGASWFNQHVPVSTIITELRKRGVRVATWSYHYGMNAVGEAQRVIETLAAAPDFHVFDVEAEVEGLANPAAYATTLLSTINAMNRNNVPLCYAPLPAIRYHLKLPYRQFTDDKCAMLPQLYWTGLNWTVQQTTTVFYGDALQYALVGEGLPTVYPVYEDSTGFAPTAADVDAFATSIMQHGATGASVWSYEEMDDAAWARARSVALALSPPIPPTPDPGNLAQRLDALVAIAHTASQQVSAAQTALSAAETALTGADNV